MATAANRYYRKEIVFGKQEYRVKQSFAAIVFLPIFIFCVFGRIRSDTGGYLLVYNNMPTSPIYAGAYIRKSEAPGFALFSVLIKMLSQGSETAYRFAIALIHSIPLILVFRKYSEKYVYTVFLFLASTMHLAWMTNGLRQFMAVTIVFAATPWIVKKKYFRTILVILLAATIHRTALFMIPVIFIVQGEIWNRRTLLFAAVVVISTFLFSNNSLIFDQFAETTGYSLEAAREFGDNGASPFRVIFSAIPMVLSFIFRRSLREVNDPLINICVNMSVISTGIYLVAMVTSGIMVGRLPIYTSLYSLILIPYLLNCIVPVVNRDMYQLSITGAYLLFYFRSVL